MLLMSGGVVASFLLSSCTRATGRSIFSPLTRFLHGNSTSLPSVSTFSTEKEYEMIQITKQPNQGREHPPPTVLLFGWVGSKMKHLEKYRKAYHDRGCNTVVTILPTNYVFFDFAGNTKDFSEFLVSTVVQNNLHKGGILIHSLSNGGAFIFQQFPELCKQTPGLKPFFDSMEGIVFDSAPCHMSFTASRSVSSIMLNLKPDGWPSFFVGSFFTLMSVVVNCLGDHSPWKFWGDMKSWSFGPKMKEIYFYSDNDKVLDMKKLEDLVAFRKENAQANNTDPNPSMYFFKGMAHVTLIRNEELFNEGVSELLNYHTKFHQQYQ
eukprot:m.138871 g.138871  ORF g.138871 m.138871 type:complete len:321 (-) comp17394_c0_seq1:102-1064(-)